ncbi:MAG TPA: hypothetical protein VF637_01720 [Sphingomicrobium sp.]|jgi:hypothetical protein
MQKPSATWAAVGAGTLIALFAGRSLFPKARLAVRRVAGFTYRDQKAGSSRPSVDPSAGRPA